MLLTCRKFHADAGLKNATSSQGVEAERVGSSNSEHFHPHVPGDPGDIFKGDMDWRNVLAQQSYPKPKIDFMMSTKPRC